MPLRLFNSLTKRPEEFIPADPAKVTFYTCGPTVYDDAHIGNFRSFLAADLLRRWIESPLCDLADGQGGVHKGPRTVVHVMNITDVGHMTDDAEGGETGEDRMAVAGRRLLEAKKAGKLPADLQIDPGNPYQIAEYFAGRFLEDARKLGLKVALDAHKDPTLMPRATANVPGMIEVVARLIARGHAYVSGPTGARAVYFRVKSFTPYGRLSGNTLDRLREGQGGRISAANQSQKEHPADFLLWKEDPSHIMKWDSPWGPGYPGWHIECTVMSARRLLGDGAFHNLLASPTAPGAIIDLHSGGEDNIFPHHECEIAQSCCAFNTDPALGTFARLWFHPRFLLVEGTKMSKSKGNFFTARDLFARGIEPAALRLEIIKTHYRSNANFTEQGLKDSQSRLERWRRYARRVIRRSSGPIPGITVTSVAGEISPTAFLEQFEAEFTSALQDDLNVARVIAAIDTQCSDFLDKAYSRAEVWAGAHGYEDSPLPPLPPSPISTDQALEMLQRGKANRTNEWELGLLYLIDGVLSVIFQAEPASSQTSIGVFLDGLSPDPAVIARLEDRRAARAAKDFKRSDTIRDELGAMGYAIKDIAGGKVEVRRK